jgi:N-acetylmuramoyl-L-alanine amidase
MTQKTITVSPGHGGKRPGATNIDVFEKDIVLDISKKLYCKLQGIDYNVIMTRDMDYNVGLYERAEIANKNNSDIFVSIHTNSCNNSSVQGSEVLYYPGSKQGKVLANDVLYQLVQAIERPSRGLKKRPNLVVLRETNMTAILVEVAFLSNEDEKELMLNENNQYIIADAIKKGIDIYFDKKDD